MSGPSAPLRVGSFAVRNLVYGCCSLATGTIFLCYTIAVALGHVPAWLPMISDCAVYPPEKYIFRVGMILSGALIFVNTLAYLFWLGGKAANGSQPSDKVALFFSGVGSIGLMGLAAVNEAEDNSVHSTFAVVFFVFTQVYECIATYRLWHDVAPVHPVSTFSLVLKSLISVGGSIMLIGFILMSMHWGRYHLDIAIIEWTGVGLIIIFELSCNLEYAQNERIGTLLYASSANTRAARSVQPAQAELSEVASYPTHMHVRGVPMPTHVSGLWQPYSMVPMTYAFAPTQAC